MNTSISPSCPHCGQTDLAYLGKLPDSNRFGGSHLAVTLPGGALYLCRTCALKFRYPIQGQSVYERLYDNSTVHTWAADGDRPDWTLITNYIKRTIPTGGRVLDFGCYTGGLLARLEDSHECHGVEINFSASEIVEQRQKSRLWRTLESIPVVTQFDAIIACDVIEHMPDPGSFIETLSSRLAESGRLIITTGDANNVFWQKFGANWWYCFYPEHISFISNTWIEKFTRESDFTMEICRSFQYQKLSAFRYLADFIQVFLYGLFPNFYLNFVRMARKATDDSFSASIAGNGISSDHLFIVLTKSQHPHGLA